MWNCCVGTRSHPYKRPLLPLSCPSSNVRSDKLGHGRITQRLPSYSVLRHGRGFHHAPQDDLSSWVGCSPRKSFVYSTDHLSTNRFPERNKVPDFTTFSSLLRITTKYEMPTIRSQILEVVCDAYPETFEGLTPSKPLGETIFSDPIPHPNEVLNLFVQQKLTSALPIAYYMAIRRGPNSLMDRDLPPSATLSPEILRSVIAGLMELREVELNETHDMILGPGGSHPCSTSSCPSRTQAGLAGSVACRNFVKRIVGSSRSGTKVLEVPEFYEDCGGHVKCIGPGICDNCVERWEAGLAESRKRAWTMLPDVFGLND